MAMKRNLEYRELSLENPDFIQRVERLRELIIAYCVLSESGKNLTEIFEEIYDILIQYTEFVAFWKVFDVSFSGFKKEAI